jgi:hypothetical protein
MALKIISGFIRPKKSARRQGSATLNLTTGSFSANDPITVFNRKIIGSGTIKGKPCVTLSLRRVSFFVGDGSPNNRRNDVDLDLDDVFLPSGATSPTQLKIKWAITHFVGGSNIPLAEDGIREISFMIIGETA